MFLAITEYITFILLEFMYLRFILNETLRLATNIS